MNNSKRMWVLDHFPKKAFGFEIGVWRGTWSHNILERCKPKYFWMIDPWVYDPSLPKSLYGNEGMDQDKMNQIFYNVKNRFHNRNNVTIVRYPSSWIATNLNNNSFDFCYIDGDHRYDGVKQDLIMSYDKIKPGGIIAGDDYNLGGWWGDGVICAVDEFRELYPIETIKIQNGQFVLKKVK